MVHVRDAAGGPHSALDDNALEGKALEGKALEAGTVRLINVVAYTGHARDFSRGFAEVTGIVLPGAELRTFVALTSGATVSTGELATALAIDLGQASRQVSTLVEAGLARRHPDPADRRRSLVQISAEGARITLHWRRAWVQGYLEPVLSLTIEEVTALTEWLALVGDALERSLGTGDSGLGLPPGWHRASGVQADDPVLRPYLATIVRVVELVSRSRGFEKLLGTLRAPVSQHVYLALRLISRHGPMPIAEIAAQMGVEPSRASKRVRALQEHGLVERETGGRDRRTAVVRAAPRGAELIRQVHELQLTSFCALVDGIDPADRARWTPPMLRLADRLARPTPPFQGATA